MDQNYTPDVAKTLAATGIQTWQKQAADGAAATATAETVIGAQGPANGFQLGAVQFVPAAALTADPTNNATITVNKRTAGGAAVPIAIGTTAPSGANSTGSWSAWVPVNLTIQAGATLAPGDTVTVAITKGGSGVVVPQGQLEIYPALN